MEGARDFVGRDEYVPPYMCRIDQEGIEYGNKEDKSIQIRPHQSNRTSIIQTQS